MGVDHTFNLAIGFRVSRKETLAAFKASGAEGAQDEMYESEVDEYLSGWLQATCSCIMFSAYSGDYDDDYFVGLGRTALAKMNYGSGSYRGRASANGSVSVDGLIAHKEEIDLLGERLRSHGIAMSEATILVCGRIH